MLCGRIGNLGSGGGRGVYGACLAVEVSKYMTTNRTAGSGRRGRACLGVETRKYINSGRIT